jgi:hypothetical protein
LLWQRVDRHRERLEEEHRCPDAPCKLALAIGIIAGPISDLEIGFYASLPCLLGIKNVREGRSFKWDDAKKQAVAV